LRTHAPSTYKIPACSDRPDVFNVALYGVENPEDTIGKSKAVGEPPFVHGASVFCALSHAISDCGDTYPALNAPATAEEIMRAIKRAKS
jgi:xanthine dehydrogenase large subunit